MPIAQYTNAKPFDVSSLADWIFRKLGFPVITVNVDQDQAHDRILEAIEKYQCEHMNGNEVVHIELVVTAQDVLNGFMTAPPELISIISVFGYATAAQVAAHANQPPANNFSDTALFDASDMMLGIGLVGGGAGSQISNPTLDQANPTDRSMPLTTMYLQSNYLQMFNDLFGSTPSDIPIRFSPDAGRIFLDGAQLFEGDKWIFIGRAGIDLAANPSVFNDKWVRAYAFALVKETWGSNMRKFTGVALPGGVQMDGDKYYEEAIAEQRRLEEELETKYSLPPMFYLG